MNNKTPICDAIADYNLHINYRYHTPGHAGGSIKPHNYLPWGDNLWKYDVTEVENLDNLLNEHGVIAESENLTADLYNVNNTLYLTQGSTSGLQIAIMATVKPGEKVLVQRNSHMSIWNSLILSGADPVWLEVEYDIWGLPEPFSVNKVADTLAKYPDIVAVVVQNPTYEGKAGDISELVKLVHSYHIPLIVDEAHGAHWHFSSLFPLSAVDAGADIVVQSAHKTLPVLTGGAYLHSQGSYVTIDKLKEMRRVIHSSSPSYLIMASLDAAQAYLSANSSNEYSQLFKRISKIYDSAKQFEAITLRPFRTETSDFTKINLNFPAYCSVNCINMLKEYGIMFEKSDGRNVLFLATLGTSVESVNKLINCLIKCAKDFIASDKEDYGDLVFQAPVIGENIYNPRDMLYKDKEWIRLVEAVGRIAADPIVNYPPGVPLVLPGELITESLVEFVKHHSKQNKVVGVDSKSEQLFVRVAR